MLESLDTLLQLSLIHKFHDKATIKKLSLKMLKRCAPHVVGEILNDVLKSTDPKATVDMHANRFISLNSAANEINNMGFVGMVIHAGIAYPLNIIVEDVYDRQFVLENERRIANQAALRLEEEIEVGKSTCDVVFFKNRGFSGIRYNLTIGK